MQQQGNRSIYFAFGPEAILSGVHLASYPILSGEAWVANGRYARKLSPQNPAPAVYAARGSCTLTFTGHPTASPETVRRAFSRKSASKSYVHKPDPYEIEALSFAKLPRMLQP